MRDWLGAAVDAIIVLWAAVLPSFASTFSPVMSMLQFICIHQAVTFARHLTQICHMVTAIVMIHQCTWLLAMQWNLSCGLYVCCLLFLLQYGFYICPYAVSSGQRTCFYRAAWNADAVLRWEFCLSVRLWICQTRALWQNGRKICLDFYTLRKII